MSAFTRTRTLYQWLNTIYLTHFSKRIHFLVPLIICIGKICCLRTLFVIIEIKYNKSAHSIGQQRIYTY